MLRPATWVLLALAGGSAVAAASGAYRAHQLARSAEALSERGRAEGGEFVATLSTEYAERQLGTFERRRERLREAASWRRVQMLGLAAAVLLAFSAYVIQALAQVRQMTEDSGVKSPGRRGP